MDGTGQTIQHRHVHLQLHHRNGHQHRKTKYIPLWDEPLQSVIDRMQLPCNSHLPQYTWASSGKHLCFMIGPGSPQESWLAPTTKYNQRVQEWPMTPKTLPLDMHQQHLHSTNATLHSPAGTSTQNHNTSRNQSAKSYRRWPQGLVYHARSPAP